MITLKDFSIGFGDRVLLDNVNSVFAKGKLTALLGRNGSGKSTLLRAIAGLNRAYTGSIILNGKNISSIKQHNLALILSFVTTARTRIPNMTCEDVVELGRAPYTNWIGRTRPEDIDVVKSSLALVGMAEYSHRTMDTMSDGECQRIMIARALAQSTPVILLDEPTSFLDMPNRYELGTLLQKLAHNENKCIIFSTHELDIALNLCDDIALIDNGMLYHMPAKEMKHSGEIQRLFGIDISGSEIFKSLSGFNSY